MIELLVRFWQERGAREQAVVKIASVLLVLALAHAYVWLPVSRERDRLLVRVPELRAEARAMGRDAREMESLESVATAPVSPRTAILQAGAASQLAENAVEIAQMDSSTFRVVVESAPEQQALAWVARLQAATGIRVENIHLRSSGRGDRVRIQASVVPVR